MVSAPGPPVVAALHAVPGETAFFVDDQAAIREGRERDGFLYAGPSRTPGFRSVREPGEALLVLAITGEGHVGTGDCATVQYSGAAGRQGPFRANVALEELSRHVVPAYSGRRLDGFEAACEPLRELRLAGRVSAAVAYGVSQALLAALALHRRLTATELICEEYGLPLPTGPLPVFAQSGDEAPTAIDRMVLKRVDELPHGLINSTEKVGPRGRRLLEWVAALRERIIRVREDPAYEPVLHLDVYGTLGLAFDRRPAALADYLARLADAARPLSLRIEHPIDAGSRDAQVEALADLRRRLGSAGARVDLVVDEWCNDLDDVRAFIDGDAADMVHVKTPDLGELARTVDALLLCREHDMAAYCGGTCNETDRSAIACTHVALACDADLLLAKPGMGVDEGLTIVRNEMARTLALLGSRRGNDPD
jgi:methylaspartate ammonia-lyase